MKNIYLLIILIIPSCFFSQEKDSSVFCLSPSNSHDLYIRFENGIILANDVDFTSQAVDKINGFEGLHRKFSIHLDQGIPISEVQFLEMEQKAFSLNNNIDKISNLRSIFKVKISNPTNENLYNLGLQLMQLKGVVYCSLISATAVQPPTDIPPATASYQLQQGYIGSNPGVNMQYAWDNFQTGTGIVIRDIEYGFNANHEEFVAGASSIAVGMTVSTQASADYTEHGTAVFGVVYAKKGIYGVSGLAHGAAAMILYPEWQQSGYNRINAVSQAVANAQTGDVVIYEMQEYGQNSNFVPAEYNQVVWDLTVAANAIGAVVVAAAGNGNQNLDDLFYVPYMNRGDSGAIIVGAGTSNTLHNKLSFSTYGSRVDLQGWGQNVYTTGYFAGSSSSFLIGNDFNQSYNTSFNGTSSATPIVASCVAVLQSYYHSLTGNYLTSAQLKSILQQTGIAQSNAALGNIGAFPNMQNAMQWIANNYFLDVNTSKKHSFSMFPNPTSSKVNIAVATDFLEDSTIWIFNNLGQEVYSATLSDQTKIDVSNLANGVYFVQVNSKSGFSTTKKLVKQ